MLSRVKEKDADGAVFWLGHSANGQDVEIWLVALLHDVTVKGLALDRNTCDNFQGVLEPVYSLVWANLNLVLLAVQIAFHPQLALK